MPKAFSRDRALHSGYRAGGRGNSRRAKKQLQRELKQLSLCVQPSIAELLKAIVDGAALSREIQRADALAEIEAAERSEPLIRPDGRGYLVQRATEKPTAEETEALMRYEREHLGVDRVAGTVRPWSI